MQQVGLAWQGLRRSFRHLRSAAVWAPWLLLGALQLALLACWVEFAHPAVSWFMAPLVRALGGEDALRYPQLLAMLPALFARANLAFSILFGAVAAGAGLWLFARRLRGEAARAGDGLRVGVSRAGALVIVNLPASLLIAALLGGSEWWVAAHPGSRMMERALLVGGVVGALALQALFAFVSAAVVLDGDSAPRALSRVGADAGRGFWAALALAAGLFLPHLPAFALGRVSPVLVQRGVPELVAALVASDILVGVVTGTLMSGGIALVFLTAVSERSEESA